MEDSRVPPRTGGSLPALLAAAAAAACLAAGSGTCAPLQAAAGRAAGTATTTADRVPPPEEVGAVIGHLGPVPVPPGNPLTRAKAKLGGRLFDDPGLSDDGSLSCRSCHWPDHGYAVPRALGPAHPGRAERRNSPSLVNVAFSPALTWDGRAGSLDQQALGPLQNPLHQNNNLDALVARLGADPGYRAAFRAAFGDPAPTPERVGMALGSFERTLVFEDSPLDRYMEGDVTALDGAQTRGLALFFGRAGCAGCHNGPNLTDRQFYALGVPDAAVRDDPAVMASVRFDARRMKLPGWVLVAGDPGRQLVTHDLADRGKFRTAGLRNVEQSAPYMHDGSLATLEDVVAFYDRGGDGTVLRPLGLDEGERRDLVAFLKALTGKQRQPAFEGASIAR
jgi:cytochrome c peroxidase